MQTAKPKRSTNQLSRRQFNPLIEHRANPGPNSHYDSTFLFETKNSTTEITLPHPVHRGNRDAEGRRNQAGIPNEKGKELGGKRRDRQSARRTITADLDGGVDSEQVGLGEEHPLSLDAELSDLRLRKLHLAPAAAALHEPAHHLVHRRALHRPHRGPRHHHLTAVPPSCPGDGTAAACGGGREIV